MFSRQPFPIQFFATALLTLSMIAGCSKKSADVSETSKELDHKPSEFQKEIENLIETSRAAIVKRDFDANAETWQAIHEKTATEFGADSWQAKNSELACSVAVAKSKMTLDQLSQVEQIKEAESRVAEYVKMMNLAEATNLLKATISLSESLWGSESHLTCSLQFQLAKIHEVGGNYLDAIRTLNAVNTTREKIYGKNNPDLEIGHTELAAVYELVGQYEPAIEHHVKGLGISQKLWGDESLAVAKRRNNLGAAYNKAGKFELALAQLQTSAKIRKEKLGTDSTELAHSLLNLGVTQLSMNKLAKCSATLVAAKGILNEPKDLKQKNLQVEVLSNLGTVQLLQQNFVDAQTSFQGLADLTKELAGENHPLHGDALFKLGVALGNQGKYELAEPILLQASNIQKNTLSATHPNYIRTVKTISHILKKTGRAKEATAMLAEIPTNLR